jgi:hypothetical protein
LKEDQIVTDITMLKSQLSAALSAEPQKASLAAGALDEISQGLSKLSSLGLSFYLAEGSSSSPIEYPKALYRGDGFEIAHDAAEEQALRVEGFDVHPTLRAPAQGVFGPGPLQPEQQSLF